MKKRLISNKKGQATIFIIIALIIVVLGVLIYMFFPKIKTTFGVQTENPNSFLKLCLEDDLQKTIEMVSLQGGSLSPELNYSYKGDEVAYLCYTNEYYDKCTMQQPFLREHIETEIEKDIQEKVDSCFDDLEKSFKSQGYKVSLTRKGFNVQLLPKKVRLNFDSELSLKKQDVQMYDSLSSSFKSELYRFTTIALSILNWEAVYGDVMTTPYMNYDHDLKVEKLKQSEGSTIYILTDRPSEKKFRFASRSVAWPSGYY